jgi:hypothetical protein
MAQNDDAIPVADTPEMAAALADRCIAALDGLDARAAFFDRIITGICTRTTPGSSGATGC